MVIYNRNCRLSRYGVARSAQRSKAADFQDLAVAVHKDFAIRKARFCWSSRQSKSNRQSRISAEKCLHGTRSKVSRMATRGVSCGWSKRKTRARTRSSYVRVSHRAIRSAPTRRPYAARRVGGGSALPTPRMSSGIRACCRLVIRAARHISHRGGAADMPVAASVHTS